LKVYLSQRGQADSGQRPAGRFAAPTILFRVAYTKSSILIFDFIVSSNFIGD